MNRIDHIRQRRKELLRKQYEVSAYLIVDANDPDRALEKANFAADHLEKVNCGVRIALEDSPPEEIED